MAMDGLGSGAELAALGAPEGEPIGIAPLPVKFYAGSILLLLLGVAGLGTAAYLWNNEPGELVGPLLLAGLGLIVGAPGVVNFVRRAKSRCTLALYKDGFAVVRGGKTAAIRFDELRVLSLREKERLNNGRRAGWTRKLRAVNASGVEALFEQFAAEGVVDLAGKVIQTIVSRAADAADARRASEPLRGKGWTLDREGFRAGAGVPVALGELTEAATFENKVSLWRGTETTPFFSVADDSDNARLLLTLVGRHKAKLEADPATLGRILFQKKTSAIVGVFVAFVAAGFCLSAAAILVHEPANFVGIGLFLAGLGGIAWGLSAIVSRLQCYERGLTRRSLFGTRTLRYADIDSFSFSAVRHYHNGAYTGTHVSLAFRPELGKPLSYSTTTRGNDEDLELLRDSVSQMVARRLLEGVRKGAPPSWGSARMTADGLVFHANKLIGKGPLTTLSWREADRQSMKDGVLALYGATGDKALFKISASEQNFFPGLLVYNTLVAEAQQRASA